MNWPLKLLVLVSLLPAFPPVVQSAAPEQNLMPQIAAITNLIRQPVAGTPEKLTLGNQLRGWTILFQYTAWELKSLPQSATLGHQMAQEAMALPEAERLAHMNRFDDFIQIWLFPLNQHPEPDVRLKESLVPAVRPHRYHRELAFLGKGDGYAWFGYMPIYDWTDLQQRLHLEGGDDALLAQVRGLSIADQGGMTRNSAEPRLVMAGAKAIPYLEPLLNIKVQGKEIAFDEMDARAPLPQAQPASSHYAIALQMLGQIKDPASTPILLKAAQSRAPAIAEAGRRALEFYPRTEAGPLYLQWLDQDAGKVEVFSLLRAAEQVAPKKLGPYLARVLQTPRSVHEFRLAFELSRSLAGKPIPETLLSLEQEIKTAGYASGTNYSQARVDDAVRRIVAMNDVEAEGVVGVSLATATTKGNWLPANQAGLAILKALPNNYGISLAQRVSESIGDDWIKQKLKGD